VFRNAARFAKTYNVEVVAIDAQTGEAQVAQEDSARLPRDASVAVRRRLGNLDEVVRLRETIAQVLADPKSIIISKVLYSASHSGDVIGTTEIPGMRRELAILMSAKDTSLDTFVSLMNKLLDASEAEQNPIVFV
jgi:hypothetical protein